MGRLLFTGAAIFDGKAFIDGQAVLVEDGSVVALCPASEAVDADIVVELKAGLLAPGFIDVQVNGGGGVLFNETPTAEGVRAIANAHRPFGVTSILPTLITDTPETTGAAVTAVKDAIAAGSPGCLGIHLEGPFIAPARKGAHDGDHIRSMTDKDVEFLLGLEIDTVLVTLAPDAVPPEKIRRLADGGIIVSLGHSDATHDEVARAVDAGARGVTHLFNAMSPLNHRSSGMVGAALELGGLWCGIIADGHHVDPAAFRVALSAKNGPGRLFLVSDAMPTVGDAGDVFELNGRTVTRDGGRLTLADGTLAGSDLDLASAVRFAVGELGVPRAEALRMASLYPATLLRKNDRYGRIRPGYLGIERRQHAVANGPEMDAHAFGGEIGVAAGDCFVKRVMLVKAGMVGGWQCR
jgi:N-acetylglucosamine-6-phosphate deacetylase